MRILPFRRVETRFSISPSILHSILRFGVSHYRVSIPQRFLIFPRVIRYHFHVLEFQKINPVPNDLYRRPRNIYYMRVFFSYIVLYINFTCYHLILHIPSLVELCFISSFRYFHVFLILIDPRGTISIWSYTPVPCTVRVPFYLISYLIVF